VKSIVRLAVLTTVCFFLVFIISALLSFLQLRIFTTVSSPVQSLVTLKTAVSHIVWTLPLSLYSTVWLSTNYSLRHKISRLASFIVVSLISTALAAALVQGLTLASGMEVPFYHTHNEQLAKPGLLLSEGEIGIILLEEPSTKSAARVISVPESPLYYEKNPIDAHSEIIKAPGTPFEKESVWVLENCYLDFSLSASEIQLSFERGFASFLCRILPLAALLVGLSFMCPSGKNPLVHLFLSAIVFRLVLMLEVFVNSNEVQTVLRNFFQGRIEPRFISPLVFTVLALLSLIFVLSAALKPFPREKVRNDNAEF
jgi:hypothetical protein